MFLDCSNESCQIAYSLELTALPTTAGPAAVPLDEVGVFVCPHDDVPIGCALGDLAEAVERVGERLGAHEESLAVIGDEYPVSGEAPSMRPSKAPLIDGALAREWQWGGWTLPVALISIPSFSAKVRFPPVRSVSFRPGAGRQYWKPGRRVRRSRRFACGS